MNRRHRVPGLQQDLRHAPSRSTVSTSRSRRVRCTASSGPNGSGKSTTIRILLGLLRADGGTATPARRRTRGATRPSCTAASPTCPATSRSGPTSPAARSSTCSPGCAAASTSARRRRARRPLRPRPDQEGPGLLQGQPAEGGARGGARLAMPSCSSSTSPTSGLDPLMEAVFQDERPRGLATAGRTVLLSSHILTEVERPATASASCAPGASSSPAPSADLRHLTRTTRPRRAGEAPAPTAVEALPGSTTSPSRARRPAVGRRRPPRRRSWHGSVAGRCWPSPASRRPWRSSSSRTTARVPRHEPRRARRCARPVRLAWRARPHPRARVSLLGLALLSVGSAQATLALYPDDTSRRGGPAPASSRNPAVIAMYGPLGAADRSTPSPSSRRRDGRLLTARARLRRRARHTRAEEEPGRLELRGVRASSGAGHARDRRVLALGAVVAAVILGHRARGARASTSAAASCSASPDAAGICYGRGGRRPALVDHPRCEAGHRGGASPSRYRGRGLGATRAHASGGCRRSAGPGRVEAYGATAGGCCSSGSAGCARLASAWGARPT